MRRTIDWGALIVVSLLAVGAVGFFVFAAVKLIAGSDSARVHAEISELPLPPDATIAGSIEVPDAIGPQYVQMVVIEGPSDVSSRRLATAEMYVLISDGWRPFAGSNFAAERPDNHDTVDFESARVRMREHPRGYPPRIRNLVRNADRPAILMSLAPPEPSG